MEERRKAGVVELVSVSKGGEMGCDSCNDVSRSASWKVGGVFDGAIVL